MPGRRSKGEKQEREKIGCVNSCYIKVVYYIFSIQIRKEREEESREAARGRRGTAAAAV